MPQSKPLAPPLPYPTPPLPPSLPHPKLYRDIIER